MEGEKYFVLIDESTDLAYIKWLCIAARYYSNGKKHFVASLHNYIVPVEETGHYFYQSGSLFELFGVFPIMPIWQLWAWYLDLNEKL